MKSYAKLILFIFLMTIYPQIVYAEGFVLFADQPLSELTLVATYPQSGQFSIADIHGNVQDGTLDDFIGIELAKVTTVGEITIEVTTEEEFDWYGTVRTRTFTQKIPLAQALEGKGVR